ncbi:peptidase inhibitor 16-like, partial [Thrips palmi]|uniref:Peptidase inhibitor 16-like n=1 Tax=Thrips palmi TaxID=161013 RepID=A0A6P8Z4D4_THRPL
MGARGVSVVATILLVVALSPVRPEPEPAQSPFKAGATKNTKNPYCSIACRSGAAHTLCQYSAGPPSTCKDGRAWPLNGAERGAVLHAHNLLRNKMASGGVPPFPSGANMRQMEWDAELEQIAQRWADQCSFAHDQCRDSGRFTVGQNVAIYFSSAAKFPPIESRVHSWYDEIRDYAYAEGPFSFSFATGHFTQVVWGDTWLVGCGRARYEENGLPTQLLVCNYGPAGNVETEPLYRQGAPCSACQPGTACSPTYPALCAGQGASQLVQFSLEPAAAPLSLTPSTVAPTAPPAIGLRGFFGDVTQNSILPSSVSPALFGGSTLKPFTPIKPFAAALPSTTATPVLSTESPDEFGQPGCPIPKSVGPTCKQHRAAPLSAAERATMLDFHNVKRSAIAAGDLPGFKPAADMKQMYWDEELEALAQTWADKCEWGHDPCRSTARWAVKGQNLGLTFSLDWTFPASTERVEDWYQELKLYNYTTGPFTFAPATSHFTQLAWADTYLVGCGRTRYMSEHGLPSEYLVCNYGPGGNIFGNPLYREGPPCAKCPFSCSDRYPGLCTRIEDSNEVGTGTPLSLQALKLDEPSSPPFL